MDSERVVILVDMDCFYCQVEARLNPSLKGKPMAVVQYNQWKGGGIIAVNYEARDFGVTRSMRGNEAKAKCSDIILVHVSSVRGKADLSKYRDAGREVVDVLCQFSDCIQRASVDEAYIDITRTVEERIKDLPRLVPSQLPNTFVVGYADNTNNEDVRLKSLEEWLNIAYRQRDKDQLKLAVGGIVVEEMRAAVFSQTGFRCSAGIAHNKVLSKLACGLHKPNRQTILPEPSVSGLFDSLPIRKVKNLGGKFGEILKDQFQINVMSDLKIYSEHQLQHLFDQKTGSWLYNIARGIDHEPVTPRLLSKSIGCCKKFPGRQALAKRQDVEFWLSELAAEVAERLEKDLEENKRRAKLLTVSFLQASSCSRSGPLTSYDAQKIASDALELIKKSNSGDQDAWHPPLKFLGLSVGKFVEEGSSKTSTLLNFFKTADKPADASCRNATTDCSVQPEQNDVKPKDKSSLKNSFFMKYLKQKADGNFVAPAAVSSDEDMFDERDMETVTVKEINSNFEHLIPKVRSDKPSTSKASKVTTSESAPKDSSAVGMHVVASTSRSEPDESFCVSISEIFPNLDDVDEDIVEMLPRTLQERLRSRIETCGMMPQRTEKVDQLGHSVIKDHCSSTEVNEKIGDGSGGKEEDEMGHFQLDVKGKRNGKTTKVKTNKDTPYSNHVRNSKVLEESASSKNSVPQRSEREDPASEEDDELHYWQQESSENLQQVNGGSVSSDEQNHKHVPMTVAQSNKFSNIELNERSERLKDHNNEESTAKKHSKMPQDLDAITAWEEDPSETSVDKEDLVENCLQCNKAIPLVEYLEHLDFHAAEILHRELNHVPLSAPPQKVKVAEIPSKRKRGRSSRRGAAVIGSDKKMRSITAYFTPK